MTAPGPTIGLLLVNWNSGPLTLACLDSIRAGTRLPERTLVVDNASRDGSQDALRARFPDIELLQLDHNVGFTGANNLGIRRLLDQGLDAVWILNNDTTVDSGCLAALCAALTASPGLSVVTAKILFDTPTPTLWFAGGELNALTLNGRHRGFRQADRGQHDIATDIGFACGCCMLVRAEAFQRVGLFDSRYFAYGEDVEWSHRARRASLRMGYVPSAMLRHHVSASVRRNATSSAGFVSPLAHRLQSRNLLYTIRMHAPSRARAAIAYSAFALHNAYLLAGLLLRGRFDKLHARLCGIREGLAHGG